MDRLTFYQKLIETGILPLYYDANIENCKNIALACYQAGATAFEFTNRGAHALSIFSALRKFINEKKIDLTLGVGSIIDPQTAALFVQSGAEFVVGPFLNNDLSLWCNKRKIAYIPGCATPQEISSAEELGAEIVKVFPANVLGPSFVKSVLGPMPWTKLMPTGGVRPDKANITAWIKSGAVCVGLGSQFFKKELIEVGQFAQIDNMISNSLTWISEARGS
ncbi:MAG: bifunctional 4-hydroxy-2-oxoglutarate aldolase/2-dehydro-3-deoxy-phosphogluconate aldolase [Anaerolineaceae bacterium]|nr:bifunctional 4-hydroxy-2-oxoglutarate aldolase/2-dehydro-3-deoxy-phosphogluconate aldolase [Anaerolineaceae bacterium]